MAKWKDEFVDEILMLLDRIEIEEDSELARQRFDIAENHGYTVEITGEIVSGAMN